ncbi:MAG: metallophosphoesterase [Acidobacteriota bacterium]
MKQKIKQNLLLITVIILSFIAGGIAYKYKFPVFSYVDKFLNVFYPEFFYPAYEQKSSEIFEKKEVTHPFTFIVYGDSREFAGIQKTLVVKKIIEERPSFVIHLGDMVTYSDEHQWEIFDAFDGEIIKNGIPFYPVLGNHEYRVMFQERGEPSKLLRSYFKRFPFLEERRWYSFVYGNCKFIILDTMTDHSPESAQARWLKEELKKKDSDFLFVAMHHPPYTKTTHGGARKAEKKLAQLFESYAQEDFKKVDIVFAAHKHNYERYVNNRINYVVSAGGGAPPYLVKRDKNDIFREKGFTYHYCKIRIKEKDAIFQMIQLKNNLKSWKIGDAFSFSN